MTAFNAVLVYSSLLLGSLLLWRHSKKVAYFFLLFGLLSTGIHHFAGFAFSQHLLLFLTFVFVFSLAKLLEKYQAIYFWIACVCLSLMFHAEPPLTFFSLPAHALVTIYSLRKTKKLNFLSLLLGLVVFAIPFTPQVVFELRHQFIEIRSLLDYFRGQNQSLGGNLPFLSRLIDRPQKFFWLFQLSSFETLPIASLTVFIGTIYINLRYKAVGFLKRFSQVNIVYLATLLFGFLLFPPELKGFYLEGLVLIYLFFIATAAAKLWSLKRGPIVIIFLILTMFAINKLPGKISDWRSSTGVYANQKDIIDWIYQKAKGESFKVYTYDPAIYDYPYQYLFLWRGPEKYGYLPEEFSYLPGKTDYVQKKPEQLARLAPLIKTGSQRLFLIITPGSYETWRLSWLENFPLEKYPLVEKATFLDQTVVEERLLK